MYPELIKSPISDGKKYYLKKRPGLAFFQSGPTGHAQGVFYWGNTGSYYSAVAGGLYRDGVLILVLSSSTNQVGFCEFRNDSIDELFVCDGTSGWVVHSDNTVNIVASPNFPSPHIPTPVFLDGYIFLSAVGTQTIHNSALNDPLTWPSDGFIDAEMYPDNAVALTKAQNYLVVVGTQSVEFFYDNANATGSPLQRNAPAVSQFGTPAGATVNQTEKEVILVGETSNGGRTVWVIDGFQPTEIATEPVREALDLEGANMAGAWANTIQCAGHKWYVLNLIFSQRTFVYDFEEKMWHEWSSGLSQTMFMGRYATDAGFGSPVWLTQTGGGLLALAPTNFADQSVQINCQVITSKIDFDTIKRKRFYRLSLITDAPNSNTNEPMLVEWSDDDYNTWIGGLTLNINASYPTITQLGISRRRAFRFTYQQPFPLRMESFEVDIIQEVRR